MIRVRKTKFFFFLALVGFIFVGSIVGKVAVSFAQEKQCFVSLGGDVASSSASQLCYFHFTHLNSDSAQDPSHVSTINTVYYCQGNVTWKDVCDIGYSGCGPASTAMIMSSFGVAETPVDIAHEFASLGFRQCGRDASDELYALDSSWFKNLGFSRGPNLAYNSRLDLAQVQKFIDTGWLIIASSDKYPCFSSLCANAAVKVDHIVVIDGVDIPDGKIHVRDPNNCSFTHHNDENANNLFQVANSIPWIYAYPINRL